MSLYLTILDFLSWWIFVNIYGLLFKWLKSNKSSSNKEYCTHTWEKSLISRKSIDLIVKANVRKDDHQQSDPRYYLQSYSVDLLTLKNWSPSKIIIQLLFYRINSGLVQYYGQQSPKSELPGSANNQIKGEHRRTFSLLHTQHKRYSDYQTVKEKSDQQKAFVLQSLR